MRDFRPILPDELAATHRGRVARTAGFGPEHDALALRAILPCGPRNAFAKAIEAAALCAGVDGDALLVNHTLLPVHYAFSDDYESHSSRPDKQKFDALVGRPYRSLKFCRQCLKEDLDFTWLPYWRRSHQLPGVNFCPKHSSSLFTTGLPPACYSVPGEAGCPSKCCATTERMRAIEHRLHDIWSGLLAYAKPISALATRHLVRKYLEIRSASDEQAFIRKAMRVLSDDWVTREFGGAACVGSALQARVLKVADSVPTVLLLALIESDVDSILNALIDLSRMCTQIPSAHPGSRTPERGAPSGALRDRLEPSSTVS